MYRTSWMYDMGVSRRRRRRIVARTGASNSVEVLDEEEGEIGRDGRVRGEREKEREGGVGEQYLGDFALYLEMSFVGSISSTIRTLSLCPGVSGCWFCPCLSVSANRYTSYMSLPFLLPPSLLSFLPLSTPPPSYSNPPTATLPPSVSLSPMYLSQQVDYVRIE